MASDTFVRLLAIPPGAKADNEGREVGTDWLLADCGEAPDGTHYYVTTDHMGSGELSTYPLLKDPQRLAEWMVAEINEGYAAAPRARTRRRRGA